jgi:methyl-accepting chemotaxis protein
LEETTSSLKEISSIASQNAEISDEANRYMKETEEKVVESGRGMEDIEGAMKEIAESGEEIGKIIKTIDEIAFQTNLLSLNAAVEAARAGEAGAGFAVVADEVRNLAQRSAESAKNTQGLIEGIVSKIKRGEEVVKGAKESFGEVVEATKKVVEIVESIAESSKEQSRSIEGIDEAIDQLDKVSQENAAVSEETASASEELTAQANRLLEVVKELQTVVEGAGKVIIEEAQKQENSIKLIEKRRKIKKLRSGDNSGSKEITERKEIKPEEIIPLEAGDEKEFKEFKK